MERIVKAGVNMALTAEDVNAIGAFGRETLDHLVGDAVTSGKAYVGFSVVQTAPAEVTVGAGRFYRAGETFGRYDEGGVTLDLLANLPAVAKKIIAIVAYGQAIDTELEPRTFLIDAVTRQTEARVVATENARVAQISKVSGVENADPVKPAVDANQLVIAWVTVGTTGVLAIEMAAENRLLSIEAAGERLTLVEKRLDVAGSQIDTLKTDLAAQSQAIKGRAPMSFVAALAADHARVKRRIGLPEDYTAWGADIFLGPDQSDEAHADYDCLIQDGLRFPAAATSRAALALLNPLDTRVVVHDNMAMPAFTEVRRLAVSGKDAEVALATHQISNTDLVQLTETRTVVEWDGHAYANMFEGGWGEAQIVGGGHNDVGQQLPYVYQWERTNPATGEREVLQQNYSLGWNDDATGLHDRFTVTQYFVHGVFRDVRDVRWEERTIEETIAGFQVAQSFLNAQLGYLTRINLPFTRKAASGDVTVYVVETGEGGQPLEGRVIAKTTIEAADIATYPGAWTPAIFKPTALEPGKRYAVWIVTQGSHWIATVSGDKNAQGAFFAKVNDVWQQGAAGVDMPLELWFAQFAETRVEAQLDPASLAGGIKRLGINADSVTPPGTSLTFMVQVGGVWRAIPSTDEASVLASAPALAPLKVVFLGTTDMMPAVGLGAARSCVTASRQADAFVHVSAVRTMPANVDTVEVTLRAHLFDDDEHDLEVTLLRGAGYATVETADASVVLQEVDRGDAPLTKKWVFNLGAASGTYKIRIEGATDDIAQHFYVSERVDVAFTT